MWGGNWYTVERVSWIPKNGEEHPVTECGATAVETYLQGCSELLGFGFWCLTGHPSSLATVNQPPVNLMFSSSLLFIEIGL